MGDPTPRRSPLAVAQFCVTKKEKLPTCNGSGKRLSRSLAVASERHFNF